MVERNVARDVYVGRDFEAPEVEGPLDDDQRVTVCDACFRATCWQGVFFCENYRRAGTTTKTVAELRELRREHPSHWRRSVADHG